MEMQLEMETMNAVPTPRFEVGENVLAAQLLHNEAISSSEPKTSEAPT